jgi:hypothetical protein
LLNRGWTIASHSPDKIVGTLLSGKKEAIETATIEGRTITLLPERHEIRGDGTRAKIDPNLSWHRNLKESIVRELQKAPPEE